MINHHPATLPPRPSIPLYLSSDSLSCVTAGRIHSPSCIRRSLCANRRSATSDSALVFVHLLCPLPHLSLSSPFLLLYDLLLHFLSLPHGTLGHDS
ncbi:transmembrane protein, putative [Rhizoctonia solani AG-3 Rhs1AP]|uniref:Transmembrane protein, putative n=1 Tax=Rhizoctonia solani AG-3 Rhs1AP TaxID=1086054 RepID=X8JLZ0_9AGAM|nr:transmembrane protein, putative [Rhizoctonia solani AG-3 Rhs1AP]